MYKKCHSQGGSRIDGIEGGIEGTKLKHMLHNFLTIIINQNDIILILNMDAKFILIQ